MRKLRVICATVLLTFLGASSVYAQIPGESPYVYRIVAEDCQHAPKIRTLTGFRLKGTSGIITALHGVVDNCKKIVAKVLNAPDINDLKIDQVDILHDIAVLNPASGDSLSVQEGLPLGNNVIAEDKISVRGHPYGIVAQLLSTDLQLRDPPVDQLQSLLSSEVFDLLNQRKSPTPTITVLNIEGDLLPGHSGAPIFNSEGEVIGVGNGGLYRSSITWAIHWAEIELTSANDNDLKALRGLNPGPLFEFPQLFSSTPPGEWLPLEITIQGNGESEVINQTILRGRDYTYELISQHQWSISSGVIVKHNNNVMATGRIGDEWLKQQSDTKLRLQLSHCAVFLCLKSIEQSLNEIIFIDQFGNLIGQANVIFTWVYAADVEDSPKRRKTDSKGKILISEVPENAEFVKIQLQKDPCYNEVRDLSIPELQVPVLVMSVCTPTPTWTATPTNTETHTATPAPTFTATPTAKETATLTVAPTDTPTTTAQPTATPTASPTDTPIIIPPTDTPTYTSTPLPSIHYKLFVIVEDKTYEVLPIDPVTLAAEPITLEAKGGSIRRIEVILEDEQGEISPGLATYDWRFNPPDMENASRVGTGNNVLNYTVPADRKYRSIIIRVDTADFHRDINIQLTIN